MHLRLRELSFFFKASISRSILRSWRFRGHTSVHWMCCFISVLFYVCIFFYVNFGMFHRYIFRVRSLFVSCLADACFCYKVNCFALIKFLILLEVFVIFFILRLAKFISSLLAMEFVSFVFRLSFWELLILYSFRLALYIYTITGVVEETILLCISHLDIGGVKF